MDNCIKCDANQRDRQGRLCRYCSWKPLASPPPPMENARAGADEHDEIARIFVTGWAPGFSRESRERMVSQLASQLRGARMEGEAAGRARGLSDRLTENWDPNQAVPRVIREAWEAGRARGIEEGVRRVAAGITKLCDERDDSADVHCGLRIAKNEALAIADAIAKESAK